MGPIESWGKKSESKRSFNYSKREAKKTSKSTKSAFWSKVAERPHMWKDTFFFLGFFFVLFYFIFYIVERRANHQMKGYAWSLESTFRIMPGSVHRRHCFSKVKSLLCSSIPATEGTVVTPVLGKYSLLCLVSGKFAVEKQHYKHTLYVLWLNYQTSTCREEAPPGTNLGPSYQ